MCEQQKFLVIGERVEHFNREFRYARSLILSGVLCATSCYRKDPVIILLSSDNLNYALSS